MKKIINIFFLLPFVFVTLNVQAFISKFYSVSTAQAFAYLNLVFITIGTILLLFKERHPFSKIIKIWLLFFISYFLFGTIASFIHNTPSPFLAALIPVLYFISFAFYLSIPQNNKLVVRTALISFFLSTILIIIFQKFNFSLDYNGVSQYKLDRAGGVYGDANQAALVSLLTFILIYNKFQAFNKVQLVLKALFLLITLYAFVLTFSRTGFVVFLVVIGITFSKFLTFRNCLIGLGALFLLFVIFFNDKIDLSNLSVQQKERVENVIDIITLNTSKIQFSERDVLLKNMLNYVYDNPVLGNGISFSNMIRGHNTIVGVWADAGIISFLIFLYLLFQYFTKAFFSVGTKRKFSLSIIFVLTAFMLSLQTIINQPYLIVLFVYLAYYIESESHQRGEILLN